jgi:hypothetical protein
VRKGSQADTIKASLPAQYHNRVIFETVADLAKAGAFDEAVKKVTYIIHAASPVASPLSSGVSLDVFSAA